MKFSIFVSAFLGSTTGFMIHTGHPSSTVSCLGLSYLDELESSQVALSRPSVGFPGEDAETTTLAAFLGLDDTVIRNEYGRWLARYDKSFDLARYPQFKKNFLIQFQNDLKHGKFYTLNEFGDCTEEEYRQIFSYSSQAMEEPTEVKKEDTVEIIEEIKRTKASTQPKPAAVLAAEVCTKALRDRFSAITSMSEDSFHFFADLLCRNGASKK